MPAGRVFLNGATDFLSVFFSLLSAPSGLKVGLLTDMPDETADSTGLTGLEPSGGGYARLSVGVGGSNWATYGDGLVANSFTDTFPVATLDWGVITHWFLMQGTGTTLIIAQPLAESFQVLAGMAPRIDPGMLAISLGSSDDPLIT